MCTYTPQSGGKKFWRNLRGKIVSAPQHTKCIPRQSKGHSFGTFLAGQGRFGGLFCSFRLSFVGDD